LVRELDTNVTSSGLTFEEEELFENRYNAELAYNRVQLCINEIEKFQRYNVPDCPEEWKPQRLDKKIKWWKQKLIKAKEQDKKNANRRHRENEASKENVKTAKKLKVAQPILEKHSRIGKGPRMHELILDEQIDLFDQGLTERNEGVQQPSGKVLIRFKKHLKEKKEELNDLSNKFKELKSLVYQYKDNKEKEIEVLMDNQTSIKHEIDKNKEVYEKIIDDAADKIENFIQKANLDNQIQ